MLPTLPAPALLIVAAFSRHPEAHAWARTELERAFGPIPLSSEPYPFVQTGYYEPQMGKGLVKVLHGFERRVELDRLAAIKRRTIGLEQTLAASRRFPESRPLNLDPGLLTLGKFMLATTKDQAHRIYLAEGIFAEVTLRFEQGEFHPCPWTYADYRLPLVLEFLGKAREYYKST